ncbi:barstar family protein [Micromonospora sp. NPDC005220]|uniref:barstar family protein n=1 Tax=Micromonospora sp. NPDC005220 TaxID=3155589 RepID=UPI0033A58E3D
MALLPATGRFVVARLDGKRMTDADHTFYEFSDALLFPGYFGWNWNALSDCLRDLHWLPADGYLVVIENVQRLLSNSAEDRHILFQILWQAVERWASPLGGVVPFTVLLLCDSDVEASEVRHEVAAASGRSRRGEPTHPFHS